MMQVEGPVQMRRTSVCLLLVVLVLVLSQQVRPSPVPSPGSAHKRLARMSPLWRIMNSKPFGAFCQNNYECATGLCREGHCSAHQRPPSETLYD
ncbi:liver-expressed antimicrobial peptide 2-like [Syngnathoides biaculeatus]|uniref:liver-expressed antimicrobial peptide 2-like n=1 Tax=Syngnathoides biaculeatus TaxID=300417 RepID=UPI002ADDC84C|nr:liver-expressed antimicrobial peptide 2-like [Syngnathoides biaculeatus]XP_061664548.1 liver-expressed antimicrobial peptide 2-like [Syngnathoides biaculeatus]XP_061664549.1 liver-expressed antimicrobial peptide 2-like [Syngnathoides biaculeatus]XP_061664550.1 liver-expressed antimicrobial peptide 2-like [Syngnathoides biaculeatus]XP_061664551.1 liver-expressed antimicrobial peptide 2-like [Syngnathoides biaculeatus]